MKVLHVISDKNIGGAGVLLCNLLRHFDASIDSIVALPRGSALKERLEALGIVTVPLSYPCERLSVASVRELEAVIRASNVDLVHANAALCARIAGKRAHVTVLFTRHCCYPPKGIWRLAFVRLFGGFFNRRLADCAIATADAAVVDLQAHGISREKICVVINGSDPVRAVSAEELTAFKMRYGLTDADFIVGICARLEACKGHDTFLHAARLACERLPQVRFRFLIVGSGKRERELKDMAEHLEIADRVCFTGFVSDMAPVYRALRINVNCSCGTETSCLALSEGMSAGVPMVVSDYGGNPTMLGNGRAGILFPVGNAEALADAICRIASDKDLEQKLRKAARERYERYYTADRMTRHVTDIYHSLLKKSIDK